MSQSAFFFDAPLAEIPASQIPPKPVIPASIPTEREAFVQAALVVLETIPDGFDTDDVLDIMGLPKLYHVLVGTGRVYCKRSSNPATIRTVPVPTTNISGTWMEATSGIVG